MRFAKRDAGQAVPYGRSRSIAPRSQYASSHRSLSTAPHDVKYTNFVPLNQIKANYAAKNPQSPPNPDKGACQKWPYNVTDTSGDTSETLHDESKLVPFKEDSKESPSRFAGKNVGFNEEVKQIDHSQQHFGKVGAISQNSSKKTPMLQNHERKFNLYDEAFQNPPSIQESSLYSTASVNPFNTALNPPSRDERIYYSDLFEKLNYKHREDLLRGELKEKEAIPDIVILNDVKKPLLDMYVKSEEVNDTKDSERKSNSFGKITDMKTVSTVVLWI